MAAFSLMLLQDVKNKSLTAKLASVYGIFKPSDAKHSKSINIIYLQLQLHQIETWGPNTYTDA